MNDLSRGPSISKHRLVLVLQGGGALGAYQAGVYQGLHEAGVEPHWVIGTSIGAINAALIAGNAPPDRIERLREFWDRVGGQGTAWQLPPIAAGFASLEAVMWGVPGFFELNPLAAFGLRTPLGVNHAAFYSTEPLKATLSELVDFDHIRAREMRLTVGAVNVCSGQMTYFDNRHMPIHLEHVMASGALPPGFPAVEVDGQPYWDGGVYSNTPVEVVLDDNPRHDSLIFAVNVWQQHAPAPESIWQVLGRQKEIQYASRVTSHLARQEQIHQLRHIIRELAERLPEAAKADPKVRRMVGYGCHTTMHIISLLAPRLKDDDYTRDIDFAASRIKARWEAGYADAQRALAQRRWDHEPDPLVGVHLHDTAEDDLDNHKDHTNHDHQPTPENLVAAAMKRGG
jgi:NTE family protein